VVRQISNYFRKVAKNRIPQTIAWGPLVKWFGNWKTQTSLNAKCAKTALLAGYGGFYLHLSSDGSAFDAPEVA
jgi:hypothetical protein